MIKDFQKINKSIFCTWTIQKTTLAASIRIFKQQITINYIKNPQVETANCQQPRTLPTLSAECKDHVGRIRIRKEVNRLTDAEKTILNNALQSAIDNADPTTGLYFKDIANYHGSPTTICGGSPCCPHGLHGFLSWHRLFTGTYLSSKPTSISKICHKYEIDWLDLADVAVWKKIASILNFRAALLIFMTKEKT